MKHILSTLFIICLIGCSTTTTKTKDMNKFDITLEPAVFDNKFPALYVHIMRDGKDEGKLHIRFPEIIEAWNDKEKKSLKFYQDNRYPAWPLSLECEPLELPVKWQGDSKSQSYVMKFDNGMTLTSSAKVDGNKVELSHKLFNATDKELKHLKMWNCMMMPGIPNLADFDVERTSVKISDEKELFTEQIPESKSIIGTIKPERHRFNAYCDASQRAYNENPHIGKHPGLPDDLNETIYYWECPDSIDEPVISTVSKDGSWGMATQSDNAPSVWTNPGIPCHHSDPTYPLCKAGETAEIKNEIEFFGKKN